MNWDECLARAPRLAARTMGEETYIVSTSDSTLHLLPNEVATRIWSLADGRHSLRQIHREICEEYEVDPAVAEADLREFVSSLLSRGLALLGSCPTREPAADG